MPALPAACAVLRAGAGVEVRCLWISARLRWWSDREAVVLVVCSCVLEGIEHILGTDGDGAASMVFRRQELHDQHRHFSCGMCGS